MSYPHRVNKKDNMFAFVCFNSFRCMGFLYNNIKTYFQVFIIFVNDYSRVWGPLYR